MTVDGKIVLMNSQSLKNNLNHDDDDDDDDDMEGNFSRFKFISNTHGFLFLYLIRQQ